MTVNYWYDIFAFITMKKTYCMIQGSKLETMLLLYMYLTDRCQNTTQVVDTVAGHQENISHWNCLTLNDFYNIE